MAYEGVEMRRTLRQRIYQQSLEPGKVRSGDQGAPGNRDPRPVRDISGLAYMGFVIFGVDGGPTFNPDGELP